MAHEIQMTEQEAIDLLNKWKTENRVIHLTLDSGAAITKVVGRIDGITGKKVFFSGAKSTYSLGKYNLSQFSVEGCRFEYSDAKDAHSRFARKCSGTTLSFTFITFTAQ